MKGKDASMESQGVLKSKGEVKIVNFFPTDPRGCICHGLVQKYSDEWSRMSPEEVEKDKLEMGELTCPNAEGKKRFLIRCTGCGAPIAYVHADDDKLANACNLHYISELRQESFSEKRFFKKVSKKKKVSLVSGTVRFKQPQWIGCMAVNISPTDNKFGFECTCGQDTRDCRSMLVMRPQMAEESKRRLEGREFGKVNSKFIAEEIK